jgi:hypothetical protein
MRVKKAIKKIAALGVGATMMGATLLGATAALYDLGAYPEPFVKEGKFNGLLVVGDDAAPADIIGVTDIAIALQYSSTVKEVINVGGAAGEVALSGDSVKFERAGDVLEIGEYLGNVVETFDSADVEALNSFTVSNDKGTTDVNQYLRFSWGSATTEQVNASVVYSQDDNDQVGDFLYFKDGGNAFRWELEFEEGFESDIETDRSLEDLEDETLAVLGEDAAVTQATYSSAKKLTLELMGGAVHDTLEEGETKTYTIKGKEYETTVLIIADDSGKVKFKINGEVTKALDDGETEILNDGTTLGVREVLSNEAGETSGGDIVEFYLGAHKIHLDDVTTGATTTDGNVEIDEETIEDAEVNMDFTNASDTIRINKITYTLTVDGAAGDEPYVMPGHGLREMLDEPMGMLGSSWDVRYEGLSTPGTSMVEIKSSGDDEYRLSFENIQGVKYEGLRLAYSPSGSTIDYGDDSDALIFSQSTTGNTSNTAYFTIDKDDWFVVSHNGASDSGVTRVLKLDSVDTTNQQIQLTDVGTGGQVTSQYTATDTACDAGTECSGALNIGGYTFDYAVLVSSADTTDFKYRLFVDLDDNDVLGGESKVVVRGGGMIDLGDQDTTRATYDLRPSPTTAGFFPVTLSTDNANFDEDPGADEAIVVNVTASSAEFDLDVNSNTAALLDPKTWDDNSDVKTGLSRYGVMTKETNEDNDPDSLEITYPLEQVLPQAFITFEKTVTKTGGAGTVTIEKPQRIEIGSALLASQVSDTTAANIVTVGGPCINSVTAEIMGLTYPACGEQSGMSEGEAMIKLYESGTNVAVVVAGWSADDTTRATRVLADWKTHQASGKLTGSEVKVTGTSLTQFTVTPVTGEVVEE